MCIFPFGFKMHSRSMVFKQWDSTRIGAISMYTENILLMDRFKSVQGKGGVH